MNCLNIGYFTYSGLFKTSVWNLHIPHPSGVAAEGIYLDNSLLVLQHFLIICWVMFRHCDYGIYKGWGNISTCSLTEVKDHMKLMSIICGNVGNHYSSR